ncbi:hypothetical protein Fcan01_16594 [Folsomia candida]|uniref:Uncharacterized protein n=1 Tax=Folsomia candida TaxID=158441 RepID=A0A226DXQ8_FOLCA|nr:hypothetical protein Fcan01_16594 [Folsomia candida]
MLIEDIYLVKRNLNNGSYYRCLPVKWDCKQEKIGLHGAKSQKGVLLSLCVNCLLLFCRLFATFVNSRSIVAQSEAALGAIAYLTLFMIRCDLPVDHVAVKLVDFLIRQPNVKSGKKGGTKTPKLQLGIRFLYWAAELTGLLISAILGILSFIRPCQPILLSSLFCTKANALRHEAIHVGNVFFATIEFMFTTSNY